MKSFSSAPFLNNIEITNYFKYEPRFNSIFSRNNLPRIKDGAYVIHLDDKNSKGTYWVSVFIDRNKTVYFHSFGIGYFPQEILDKIRDESITHNIFRIQDNESIMCGFYCIAYRRYAYRIKICLDYTNLFSWNDCKENAK